MLGAAQFGHGHGLPLQVADGAHPLGPDHLEAADVAPREDDDGVPCIHPDEERPDEVQDDVDLAGSQGWREKVPGHLDVLDIGEPLALQEVFGHVQGGDTDGGALRQPELRRLGRRLRSNRPGCRPRNPAVPARVSPPRNLRRLNGRACWILMGTSLPDVGQCDT